MATVNEIYALLDQKAPFRTQLGFDNAGFLVGHGEQTVTNVLVALDITPEVIEEAMETGAQLIVAHPPVIWDKLGRVTDESVTGRKILTLIEHGIAAICAHTNLDAAQGGVNDALAQAVGLIDPVPLEVDGTDENGLPYGIGRVGELSGGPMSVQGFAQRANVGLQLGGIRAMDAGVPVQKVAVGGGAGVRHNTYAASSGVFHSLGKRPSLARTSPSGKIQMPFAPMDSTSARESSYSSKKALVESQSARAESAQNTVVCR